MINRNMLLIYKKLFLSIKSNVALLITAVIVGIIVSFVAQFFYFISQKFI